MFWFMRWPKLVTGLRQQTVPNGKAKQQQMNNEKYKCTTKWIFVGAVADQLTFSVKNYKFPNNQTHISTKRREKAKGRKLYFEQPGDIEKPVCMCVCACMHACGVCVPVCAGCVCVHAPVCGGCTSACSVCVCAGCACVGCVCASACGCVCVCVHLE